jgi:hypothetical protein
MYAFFSQHFPYFPPPRPSLYPPLNLMPLPGWERVRVRGIKDGFLNGELLDFLRSFNDWGDAVNAPQRIPVRNFLCEGL